MSEHETRAKLFWSGGSQALRLPKEMRLPGSEAIVRRRGRALIVEPIEQRDEWGDFWDRLLPLKHKMRRYKTRSAEKRHRI